MWPHFGSWGFVPLVTSVAVMECHDAMSPNWSELSHDEIGVRVYHWRTFRQGTIVGYHSWGRVWIEFDDDSVEHRRRQWDKPTSTQSRIFFKTFHGNLSAFVTLKHIRDRGRG